MFGTLSRRPSWIDVFNPSTVRTDAFQARSRKMTASRMHDDRVASKALLPAKSATHIFVEPVDGALPGQIRRGFVIPFRRRIAIEAMYGARVNIAFVRNVRRVQGLVVSRPRRCKSRVELPLMHQDRRLNFRDVLWGGRTAIERRRCRKVGYEAHG